MNSARRWLESFVCSLSPLRELQAAKEPIHQMPLPLHHIPRFERPVRPAFEAQFGQVDDRKIFLERRA